MLRYIANPVLTGFTLPMLLWVRDNEPQNFERARKKLLPKDYVRFRLTGDRATDVADASGTLLFDVTHRRWSDAMMGALFSELEKEIPAISQKMLIQQLRRMEKDGMVRRIVHAQVPPRVEYGLTDWGQGLCPALDALLQWVEERDEHAAPVERDASPALGD